jgi:hypothetical protein
MKTLHLRICSACIILFAALALGACGNGGGGGTTGGGGGGPKVTPQGAWVTSFIASSPACHVIGHNAAVGAVTASEKTTVLVDGGPEGATIQCQVTGSAKFAVSAKASLNGQSLQIVIPSIDAGATEASPASGTVSLATDKTAGVPYSSPAGMPCAFSFAAGTPEGVTAGKIWVGFTCPEVDDTSGSMCSIKQGYAVFENCIEQ